MIELYKMTEGKRMTHFQDVSGQIERGPVGNEHMAITKKEFFLV